ncbi:MAG: TetR/AcrR family transcriptional regulator C-terminal domain-containing protein [Actinomycetota bacterium]|nr:TetR/AcrR family transcriptional regulator C-terminal domain-containing protein [Actinomycetota bacterium]
MGRAPQIDRDAVLRAGLLVAERDGVDGLTMGAVATELDVTPMALYRHIGNRAGLLDGLVELLIDEPTPAPAGADWEQQLRHGAEQLRETAQRYPNTFPLVLRLPATTPVARRRRDQICDVLRRAGVPDDDVARLERVISTLYLGYLVSEVGGRFAHHDRAVLDRDLELVWTMVRDTIDAAAGRAPRPAG